MRSASATDEPPYFCTTSPTTAPSEHVATDKQDTGLREVDFAISAVGRLG
jgi:hypothetical protein